MKEPVRLSRSDGKTPDGATLIPRTRVKPVAWDVTVPDTYTNWYIADTATIASAAANRAAENKTAKYQELAKTHQFVPKAIETGGAWNEKAVEFISVVGRRITEVTKEQQETMFLFQMISVALQRERDGVQEHIPVRALIFNPKGMPFRKLKPNLQFSSLWLCAKGRKNFNLKKKLKKINK